MIDKLAHKVVVSLLELNVLNLTQIERELKNIAARAVHPAIQKWLNTVARNHIINLEGPDAESEYELYSPKRPKKGIHTDQPAPEALPDWAQKAVGSKAPVHFFNPAQPRRRQFWRDLETIVDWFNTKPAGDPELQRLDRVGFEQARKAATDWRAEIDSNPWLHIKDKPQVVKDYGNGMKWVKLGTEMHMEREGNLMQHCVANGNYKTDLRNGSGEFYSLRDSKNAPHVTVEVKVDRSGARTVQQMKGKQNRAAIDKYQPYLADFIRSNKWPVVGDKDKINMNATLDTKAPVTQDTTDYPGDDD